MRYICVLSILILINGCGFDQSNATLECYYDELDHDQKLILKEFNNVYHRHLDSRYGSLENRTDRVRAFAQDLIQHHFRFVEATDTTDIRELLTRYDQSDFALIVDYDIKRYGYHRARRYFKKPHFNALEKCNCKAWDSSFVNSYLKTYREAGDLSPGRFPQYLAEEADQKELSSGIVNHLFVVEYFIPALRDIVYNTERRYQSKPKP